MFFAKLALRKRLPVFYFLSLATLSLAIWQMVLNKPLNTEAYPRGIVDFELARTTSSAHAMMATWNAETRSTVLWSLQVDFAFLSAYGLTLSLACFLLALRFQHKSPRLSRLGKFLAWAQLAAAFCDAVENVALMRVLAETPGEVWPLLAWAAASLKFFLVILGLLFLAAGFVYDRLLHTGLK